MVPFHLTQPTISRHLKVLKEARLIERGKDAQRRLRKLAIGPFQNVEQWLESFHQQWSDRFDNLASHLKDIQSMKSNHASQHSKFDTDPRDHRSERKCHHPQAKF
jgi:hypothetical protein